MVPLATSTEQKKFKIQNLTERWCKKKIITKKKEYKDHVAPVITLEMFSLENWAEDRTEPRGHVKHNQQGHALNVPGCAEQPQGPWLEVPNHSLVRAPAAPWPC